MWSSFTLIALQASVPALPVVPLAPATPVAVHLSDARPRAPVQAALARALRVEGLRTIELRGPLKEAKLERIRQQGVQALLFGVVRYDGPHQHEGFSVLNLVIEVELRSATTGAVIERLVAEGFSEGQRIDPSARVAAERAIEMLFEDLHLTRKVKELLKRETR